MVRFGGLSYHLPQGFLYKDISLFIDRGDKIGLTGKNGVGKSTLLGLISKQIVPTDGTVVIEKGVSIGYLTQDIEIKKDISVRDYIEKSNEAITNLRARLDFVNNELTTRADYESDLYLDLINEVTEINDRLVVLDAHSFAERIEIVLKGLGFKQEEFDNQIGSFSGGWQMRVELAKLLVNNPEVLLIDEPTNHLDIVSIQWLENYLKNFKGGLILISHDRRFLDNVTNRTIEIANQRLYDYKCNYSRYLVLHAEEMERAQAAKKNQDREIKRTEELINKYRAKANKASFAQSLIKKLDKVERIEVDNIQRKAFHLRFTLQQASGKKVLDMNGIKKSFGTKTIFDGLDVILARGEKIALLGPNGVGKSTLIKCITEEMAYDGQIERGHNVTVGYFAQDSAEKLDDEKTVFKTIDDIAKGEKRKDIRSILGAFLFGGEESEKKVKVLSGGERTRLAICKLLFQEFNFLIMDEPTNHLDIQSKDILKDALKNYDGTLLLVSHDREFLDGLSNKIWEIKEGKIKTHYFGVNEFLERINYEEAEMASTKNSKSAEKPKKAEDKNQLSWEEQNQIKRLQKKIKKYERKISDLEVELKEKTKTLEETPYEETDKFNAASEDYKNTEAELEKAMTIWEDSEMELDELNTKVQA
ncbi:MAG: ABC-F family ATP-binding cassette domain-containing protein [Crocinitomix sp.]|nr:ABC-F family ATP-binding cassette domain-containing protein [Crocinitomix sp.]